MVYVYFMVKSSAGVNHREFLLHVHIQTLFMGHSSGSFYSRVGVQETVHCSVFTEGEEIIAG